MNIRPARPHFGGEPTEVCRYHKALGT